jgi:hypothetical protein
LGRSLNHNNPSWKGQRIARKPLNVSKKEAANMKTNSYSATNHEVRVFERPVVCITEEVTVRIQNALEGIEKVLTDKFVNVMNHDLTGAEDVYDYIFKNNIEIVVECQTLTDEECVTISTQYRDYVVDDILDLSSTGRLDTYELRFVRTPRGSVPVWFRIKQVYEPSNRFSCVNEPDATFEWYEQPISSVEDYETLLDVLYDGDVSHYGVNGYMRDI